MNKEKRINIRLTEKDYAIIARKAELLDVSVSEYIRVSALTRRVDGFKLQELAQDNTPIPGQMEIVDTDMGTAETGKRGRKGTK